MANDVIGFPHSLTGDVLYALVRDDEGDVWNGSTFEAYSTSNLGTYDLALTEQGTASQYYTFVFPSAIGAGIYYITVYDRAGGSPAEGDLTIATGETEWTGSVIVAQTGDSFGKWTTAITESYATVGAPPTPEQALLMILQDLQERSFSDTTKTNKKLDGIATAMTLTLDDADNPTSITRAT